MPMKKKRYGSVNAYLKPQPRPNQAVNLNHTFQTNLIDILFLAKQV